MESASLFNISHSFFQSILTSHIRINCLILWFTKAIICCTGKCSCISPVDVCYSQHLSFLHHNSISLVSRLLFGPSDVWFWSTQNCATSELEAHSSEVMEKNAWAVSEEVCLRIDDSPAPQGYVLAFLVDRPEINFSTTLST